MASKPTKLDQLVEEGAGIVHKLEKLDQNRKLSYKAFIKEALDLAETTREKVERLGLDLERRPGTLHAQQFVSKLVRVFRESNYPRCPRDSGKVLNAYGSNEAFQELTSIGATVAQAIALAVMRLHDRHGDDAFGVIENWDKFESQYTTHRDRIGEIYVEMKSAVSGLDLDTTTEGLFADEIKRGLCRVSFKRAADLGPHMGDWPTQLVVDAVASTPKPKRKRERISEAA